MARNPRALAWRVFSTPKAGHNCDEYEDAFAGDPASGRFAIADGASESSFAGAWADLLAKGFTHNSTFWPEGLPGARQAWCERFKDHPFTWYTEEKFNDGAFAAFLGISFEDSHEQWHAVAVGDCCLFQVRDERLLLAFPVEQSSAFCNQPDLLGSRQSSKEIPLATAEGDWQPSDHMFLITDALAQWFLQQTENDEEPWQEILAVTTQAEFETWISGMRASKELRNDDVTLVVIH
jgi:hypothetical protein